VITGISRVFTPLPVDGSAVERVAPAGGSIVLRVGSLPRQRPAAGEQPALPLNLAVSVLSSAPPAARGSVTSGTVGGETGVRIVPITQPDTAITYQAPTADGRAPVEYVALHYATPEDKTGVFLGSIAVRITGAA
jgi:hypothetical protein